MKDKYIIIAIILCAISYMLGILAIDHHAFTRIIPDEFGSIGEYNDWLLDQNKGLNQMIDLQDSLIHIGDSLANKNLNANTSDSLSMRYLLLDNEIKYIQDEPVE